jgi:hypothetical protein
VHYINKGKKLSVFKAVKRLSKAVGGHFYTREILKVKVTILILLLSVLKVRINMLCTLVIAVLADYIKSYLVISVENKGLKVCANVANLR